MDDSEDEYGIRLPMCFLIAIIGMFIVGFSGVNPVLIFCVPIVAFFVCFVLPHLFIAIYDYVEEKRERKKSREMAILQNNEQLKKKLADLYPETEVIIKRHISSLASEGESHETVGRRALGEFSSHATKYVEFKGLAS